jgi:hypothetical protein
MLSILLDVSLAVGILVSASYLTWQGLNPPGKGQKLNVRMIYGSFALAFACTVFQAIRNSITSSEIDKLINTEVEFKHSVVVEGTDSQGVSFRIDAYAIPHKNPARQLRFSVSHGLFRGYRGNDAQATSQMMAMYREGVGQHKDIPADTPEGQDRIISTFWKLPPQDLTDIAAKTARVYILSIAKWNNTSGTESKSQDCVFYGSDLSPDGVHINPDALPHVCPTDMDF